MSADRPTVTSRAVLLRVTVLCLAVRVALEAVGLFSLAVHGGDPWPQWLSLWSRWDAPHYLRLAEIGYVTRPSPNVDDPLFIVFFPGYPLAVHAVTWVVRDVLVSGLLVSLVASAGAGYFLHRLTALDFGDTIAWRAVILLYTCPVAYFLSAPFTEALYLATVLASVYAARVSRWPLAGVTGALATATRMAGVALGPALLLAALTTPATVWRKVGRVGWCAVAGLGLAAYLGVNWWLYGDPLYFTVAERDNWANTTAWPWKLAISAATALWHGAGGFTFIYGSVVVSFAVAVPLLVAAVWKLRAADWVYGWVALLLMASASWAISLGRYLLAVYPLFMVGGVLCRSQWVAWPVVTVCAAAQGWLMWQYAALQWTF